MAEFVPVVHGRPSDRPDDADTVRNAMLIAAALTRLGYRTRVLAVDLDFAVLAALAGEAPHAVFNLVESIRGDGRLAAAACAAMDHFALPYTGARTAAYFQSTSKLLTKTLLQAAGQPTPAFWPGDAPADRTVIVKSVCEDASLGIDQDSVVPGNLASERIREREARFGGRFFAEEYIAGREFNVSMIEQDSGPLVLPLAEMRFDRLPGARLPIVDYAAKWDPADPDVDGFERCFGAESSEPALAGALQRCALACWEIADLAGYARIDFRIDQHGLPYVIEINANPCLAPDAGFQAALTQAGWRFDDAVAAIVAAAARAGST